MPDSLRNYPFGISQFTTMPWSFDQDVAAYAELGVQAIEVCEVKLDAARVEEQMAMPAAHGLKITSVQPKTRTLFPSLSQPQPLDPNDRMALYRESIAKLSPYTPGVAYVTNTGIAPDGNIEKAIDTSVQEYRELSKFAADHGVLIALEPLNPSIMNIETAVWTLEQAMQIVHAVDEKNFGICLDCWNVWQNAALYDEIRACGEKIFVVQISDWRTPRSFMDRLIPGQGTIPLPPFLKAVREAGFAGAYSVEIFSDSVPDALWKGDLRQVIKDSRAGLDKAWQESFDAQVG